jgi:hypothetical protein
MIRLAGVDRYESTSKREKNMQQVQDNQEEGTGYCYL